MASSRLPLLPQASPRPARAQFLTTSSPVATADGFYPAEGEGVEAFHWMTRSGRLTFAPEPRPRYLEFWVSSEFADLSQTLTITSGATRTTFDLVHSWGPVAIEVPAAAAEVTLTTNQMVPPAHHPNDPRELGVRLRTIRLHADRERHQAIERQWRNSLLNSREMLSGSAELASTPRSLGIDMHGACNVKPPCVYCEWDASKQQEADAVDTPFTLDTIRGYGAFFANSENLVNCSIGEPFMMKNLDDLFDHFGDQGKSLEMSTNGQILTDRNIEKLLGRDVQLYISLDAATPLTYARLRNDTLPKILDNIRRLVKAKGGRGARPYVYLVFMPMRANIHELDDFVRLCADLGVDRLVLRPLNDSEGNGLDWERAGYHFEYDDELLPFAELVAASGRAAELCRQLGVELSDQMDFGGRLEAGFGQSFAAGRRQAPTADPGSAELDPTATASAGNSVEPAVAPSSVTATAAPPVAAATPPSLGLDARPICLEPWKSLYILRRGVRPCCYGGTSMGPMESHADAWNSPLMRGIRTELAKGGLHDYCVRSPACPIVRKAEHAHVLPMRGRALQVAWRSWQALNVATGGYPRRVLHTVRARLR